MKDISNAKYSAGAVSKGFWFQQFKKYNELLNNGLTDKEIKIKQEEENILMAPSKSYGKSMVNEVSRRTQALPEPVRGMLFNLSVGNQKILNILGMMMTDRLFFEYMYEVYREKIILGSIDFDRSDIIIFFKNKSEQSEKVSGFTLQTKKRLARAYTTYLREANFLIEEDGKLRLQKPILDIDLENEMRRMKLYPYLKIFMGD